MLESISETNPHFVPISELLARLSSVSNVPVPTSIRSNVKAEVRTLIEQSLKSGNNVSMLYHSFLKDSESTREIQPFGFQFIDGHEYLDSYCYSSKDFRLFRLDRIKSAAMMGPSEKILKEPLDVAPKQQFSVAFLSDFRRASEVLNIKIPTSDSRSEEFVSSAFNNEWIIRTICSLNSAARLTKPADLRNEVAIRANRALALYV